MLTSYLTNKNYIVYGLVKKKALRKILKAFFFFIAYMEFISFQSLFKVIDKGVTLMIEEYIIFENFFIQCPEIDFCFPPKIKSAKLMLELQRCDDEYDELIEVSCFLRRDAENQPYIDIYFFNPNIFMNELVRLVWKKGYRMDNDTETEFIGVCRQYCMRIDAQIFADFQQDVKEVFPECNIREYELTDINKYLDNLYFTLHKSGTREILYKSHLENIAFHLFEIENYNLLGQSPTDIFDLPINLLKIMNQKSMVDMIATEDLRRKAYETYVKFRDFLDIKKLLPNYSQWRYLEEYRKFSDDEHAEFNKILYKRMGEIQNDSDFLLYKKYMQIAGRLGKLCPYKKIPTSSTIYGKLNNLERLEEITKKRDVFDLGIKHNHDRFFEYEDEQYIVMLPESSYEIFLEGLSQNSCLSNYIERVAVGKTKILFLRRRTDPTKSFVTMEVSNGKIVQALTKYNATPSIDVFKFLNKYAKEKSINFDKDFLDDLFDGLMDDDLFVYLKAIYMENST